MDTDDSHAPVQATPSDTTVTLPTPDPAHAQLAGAACHHPPRFIFYPISWDGSEDPPTQRKKTADIGAEHVDDDPLDSFCYTDAFWSIDRWRRGVVDAVSAIDLLEPIQDADTPLPLLSFPPDRPKERHTPPISPHSCAADSNGSEDDSVQLWIHP